MNNWKNVWEKRSIDEKILNSGDRRAMILELKRAIGFDIVDDVMMYDAYIEEHEMVKRNLSHGVRSSIELSSIYEIGCGNGGNIFLFEEEGIKCGGIDFSHSLIDMARKICRSDDLTCGEAVDAPVDGIYDSVMSDGVFHYFQDELYAERVLKIMLKKSRFSIGIVGVHDLAKKEAFLENRKRLIENYEERYKDLPKLFLPKEFFEKFAFEHQLDINFPQYDMPGYWNNDFIFHCFMYKR